MSRTARILVGLGFAVCVGFMLLNAVLYFAHPHGRGLNLFAAIWCGVMGLVVLLSAGRMQ